jgi:rhodanese-related sulfurtransferase
MKSKVFIIIIAFILFGIAGLLYAYFYAMNSPWKISSDLAKIMIDKQKVDLILDVRTDFERKTLGFYPQSVHIQSADLEKEMPTKYPNKEIKIIAYCNTGQRARKATEILHKLGYKNAYYIVGSYTAIM